MESWDRNIGRGGWIARAASRERAGLYLQEQSSRGAGRAFSGEVADQGVQSLWWNPAAIAGMEGVDAHQAVSVILPKGSVDNVNTLIVRPGQSAAAVGGSQRSRDPINNGVLPSGAIAVGLTSRLALGLTVASLIASQPIMMPTAGHGIAPTRPSCEHTTSSHRSPTSLRQISASAPRLISNMPTHHCPTICRTYRLFSPTATRS